MATKILFCGRNHEYQDKRYGKHMIVCNSLAPKSAGPPNEFRCTVCGTQKTVNKGDKK